jgi:hypothetical protein
MKGDTQDEKHDQPDELDRGKTGMVEPEGPRVRSLALCGSEKLYAIGADSVVSPPDSVGRLDHFDSLPSGPVSRRSQ